MRNLLLAIMAAGLSNLAVVAQVPENLMVDGISPTPKELKTEAGRYHEIHVSSFCVNIYSIAFLSARLASNPIAL
jgi:hypothetical protein